jgi:hypothetical protein
VVIFVAGFSLAKLPCLCAMCATRSTSISSRRLEVFSISTSFSVSSRSYLGLAALHLEKIVQIDGNTRVKVEIWDTGTDILLVHDTSYPHHFGSRCRAVRIADTAVLAKRQWSCSRI